MQYFGWGGSSFEKLHQAGRPTRGEAFLSEEWGPVYLRCLSAKRLLAVRR